MHVFKGILLRNLHKLPWFPYESSHRLMEQILLQII